MSKAMARWTEAVLGRLQPLVPTEGRTRGLLRRVRGYLPASARNDTDPLTALLWELAHATDEVFFVQIGSNDGQQMDPLLPFVTTGGWRGLLVEPQGHAFERLKSLHANNPRLVLENAAISDHDGTESLYVVSAAPGEPEFYDLYASFRPDVILKHEVFVPDIASRVEEMKVPCLTFDSLCRRHVVDHIDLIHTDTEGYDWEILKQVDLERFRPALVVFEHVNLSAEDLAQCLGRFQANGYRTMALELDTVCLNSDNLRRAAGRRMRRRWDQLNADPGRG